MSLLPPALWFLAAVLFAFVAGVYASVYPAPVAVGGMFGASVGYLLGADDE